jgi:hypothetical protein
MAENGVHWLRDLLSEDLPTSEHSLLGLSRTEYSNHAGKRDSLVKATSEKDESVND